MSQILAEVNAGANERGDYIIRTLELTCTAWAAPILICNGFKDQTVRDEFGRTLTFTAANIEITLAAKNGKGNQTLAFGADNTTGEVSRNVDTASEARARVNATYRTFLNTNLLAPAERPYYLTVQSGEIKGNAAQIQTGYFNMIGVSWPRELYTINFTPALRYT